MTKKEKQARIDFIKEEMSYYRRSREAYEIRQDEIKRALTDITDIERAYCLELRRLTVTEGE